MKIRGERECRDCGARWSYYETGSVACPECESLRSTGVGERAEHTDSPVTLDLSPVLALVEDEPIDAVAAAAAEHASEYLRAAGFVRAGQLQPLSDDYLVAAELRRAGNTLSRAMRVSDEEELYLLSLLRAGADGERPGPSEVPESLRAERGLGAAAAIEAYLGDVRRLSDEPLEPVTAVLSSLRARYKRIQALDGDVDTSESERLVRATRDLSLYLRENDEAALARARDRLDDPV